jgi:mRNA interferase HigB
MLIVGLESIGSSLKQHAAARRPMARWAQLTEQAQWDSIIDVRRTFPHADAIKGTELTCFNIGGNSFRMLTVIYYRSQTVDVRELMTHAEYTKEYG